jgi:hypothetical protein
MKKENTTLAFTAVATTCLAFLFIYSWLHAGPPEYLPSGYRIMSSTELLGAILLFSFVSLFFQIRGKK